MAYVHNVEPVQNWLMGWMQKSPCIWCRDNSMNEIFELFNMNISILNWQQSAARHLLVDIGNLPEAKVIDRTYFINVQLSLFKLSHQWYTFLFIFPLKFFNIMNISFNSADLPTYNFTKFILLVFTAK